ncbi:hypothetical protein [Salinivibrio sp. YCSC6]|uniref:hypothetical protein n=1 Tax=Salinivibrio sp. YCSC6 TaxID=2003370 RepID=UPI000BBCD2AE|nr:hypothetical protein [Salinivibrio sp. YCSC6]PCE67448.1 hypothetical protein B6G00_03540 [Salinivibrio sp. YCSC6]QCF35649.1 hypothetical protein E8E00_05440 [Salinivibrio sp. YCSC6]
MTIFYKFINHVKVLTKEGVYLANNSPASHRGRIQGVLITLRSLLLMPSFVLIGYVIDTFGYSVTWSLVIAMAMCASIGMFLLSMRKKTRLAATSS